MKIIFHRLVLIGALATTISCQNEKKENPINSLIPKPQEVKIGDKEFLLSKDAAIVVVSESEEIKSIGEYLAAKLRASTGFKLPVVKGKDAKGNIVLALNADQPLGEEGYELTVTDESVKLTAPYPVGLFRGVQTIRQLFPAEVERTDVQNISWSLPTGSIRDFPNYGWRGMMLDVGRHFIGIEDVKHVLDEMAYYKLNAFHWSLTNDQGWRIEIKSWPKLTEVGGSTQVGGGKGGFYTQEQYKEIIQYAAARYITVVPEIDMPGHINAALASYPELNCSEQTIKLSPGNEVKRTVPGLYTGIEVGFSTLCTSKEKTYQFVNDVLGELAAITPGPYLHIGGDESHATKKEDYIPFVKRVQEIAIKHGKKVMGWDEIANSTLAPDAIVQVWAHAENGQKAIAQGGRVIMSPAKKTYLDMSYDSTCKLGLHWAAYVEVDSAYAWDPTTYLKGITRENIFGVESALWTETIQTRADIDYMTFPRLAGHAEIGWSATTTPRLWDEYKLRLATHGPRWRAMGINFYESKLVPWK